MGSCRRAQTLAILLCMPMRASCRRTQIPDHRNGTSITVEAALLQRFDEKVVQSPVTEGKPYADYVEVRKILATYFKGHKCAVVNMDHDPKTFLATMRRFVPTRNRVYRLGFSSGRPYKLHGVTLTDERANDYKQVVALASDVVQQVVENQEAMNAGTMAAAYMTLNTNRPVYHLRKLKPVSKGLLGQGIGSTALIVYHVVPNKFRYIYKDKATGRVVEQFDRAAFEAGDVEPVLSRNGAKAVESDRVIIIDDLMGSPAHKGAATALLISQVLEAFWTPWLNGGQVPKFALLDPLSDGLIKYYEKLCFEEFMDVYRVEERSLANAAPFARKGSRWALTWDGVVRCFSNPGFVRSVLRV